MMLRRGPSPPAEAAITAIASRTADIGRNDRESLPVQAKARDQFSRKQRGGFEFWSDPGVSRGTAGLQTPRRRELDSNPRSRGYGGARCGWRAAAMQPETFLVCPFGELVMHERIDPPPIGFVAGSLWRDRLQPVVFDQGANGSTKPGPILLIFLIRPVEVAFAHAFVRRSRRPSADFLVPRGHQRPH
jgi:hypothetical protein